MSAAAAAGELRSCIYEGTVSHRRARPEHKFTQRVALPLLFLDELTVLDQAHRLIALDQDRRRRRPAVMRLTRDDFLPGTAPTVTAAVHDAVAAAGGSVRGPVALLGHLRTWGWLFNPLSLYFCFDPDGQDVEWTVLEVTNTPWHERCRYVVGPPGRHTFPKAMHVSPFLPPEGTYVVRYGSPGEHLRFDFTFEAPDDAAGEAAAEAVAQPGPQFTASLALHRRPFNGAGLARLLGAHPLMTTRVSAGIYAQALRLATRGARFHPHPKVVQ